MNRRIINEDTVIEWMAEQGRTGYAAEINALLATRDEIFAEAGPNGKFCPFVQRQLAQIDAEVAEVKRAAYDRYQDWASD